MFIKSTSSYPFEEVKAIVEFAAKLSCAETNNVQVNIKNSNHAYAGRAYSKVPKIANVIDAVLTDYLITVRIGKSWRFPKDNMVNSYKWERSTNSEYNRSSKKHLFRSVSETKNGKTKSWMEKRVVTKHPYGGKNSPHIVMETWQEAMLCVTAHELNHIYQFQTNLPRSEVECEKAAERALKAFRESHVKEAA